MEISALREFLLLSETLSFSAAAKQLYISQSMLSKHIINMENELHAKLFIRDNRSVRLTDTGKAFAAAAAEILERYDRAVLEVRTLEDQVEEVLKVGYLFATTGDYFPQACTEFHKIHPNTRVSVTALEVDEIIRRVQEGRLDIGYTIAADGTIASLETSAFIRDRYGIICLKNNPLARKKSIQLRDLRGIPILMPSPTAMPTASLSSRQAFENCGFSPKLCEEMEDFGAIKPFLLTGRGVAFTLSHIVQYLGEDCVWVPIEDVEVRPYAVACWKKSHETKALLDFVECMRGALAKSDLKRSPIIDAADEGAR